MFVKFIINQLFMKYSFLSLYRGVRTMFSQSKMLGKLSSAQNVENQDVFMPKTPSQ